MSQPKRVYVCHGPTCAQHTAKLIWTSLSAEVQAHGLADVIELIVSGCLGRCEDGPNINVYPRLTKYNHLTPEKVRQIVAEHLAEDRPVRELMHLESWER